MEGVEVDKLHRQLLRIRHSGKKLDLSNNLFGSIAWAMFQTFQLACLLFNIRQCYLGVINVGDVVMYQGFFGMVVGAVQQMVNMIPQLTAGTESMRSIGEVLECPDLEHNDGKRDRGQRSAASSNFDNVGFNYEGGGRSAVQRHQPARARPVNAWRWWARRARANRR